MNRHLAIEDTLDEIDFGEMGHSLGLLLRLAQIRVFEIFFEKLAHHGLKPGEFTMLWLIGLNPDTRQGDIARRIRIKPAHMTKLVSRAVDAGLVTGGARLHAQGAGGGFRGGGLGQGVPAEQGRQQGQDDSRGR